MIDKSALLYISVFNFAFITCKILTEIDLETGPEPEEVLTAEKPIFGGPIGEIGLFPRTYSEDVNKSSKPSPNGTAFVSCIVNKPDISHSVEIVNATRLSQVLQLEHNVTHKQIPGTCVAVLFYSPSCPFSCLAAPYFNALPRFFPDIKMVAVNAMNYRTFNTQYGVVGTPTLLLFHSGRPVFKYNDTTDYGVKAFANFITKHTGIEPAGTPEVRLVDYRGPLPSIPVKETDYYLTLSWMVIAARILYSSFYSTWGRSLADATLNAWREAEAQHHHAE